MKLPFTEKFLWLLYDAYEATERALEPPEVFKLHSFKSVISGDSAFWRELKRRKRRKRFNQFINYLKRYGYIKVKELEGKEAILLTPKGRKKVLKAKILKDDSGKLKKRKDGRWIMVIFDIPEKERVIRDVFRSFLYCLGFEQLQRSVWISPYQVSDDLREIIRTYKLESNVRIFLIKEKPI